MGLGYNAIALAALLHDIGKVGQRAHQRNAGLSQGTLNLADYLCPSDPKGFRTHDHVLYTNEFCEAIKPNLPNTVNPSDLANLASYHHRPSDELQKTIATADRLSSAMEREAPEAQVSVRNFRRIPLSPVVNYVSTEPESKLSRPYGYELKRFSHQSIFPCAQAELIDLKVEYRAIWDGLIDAIKSISITDDLRFINVLSSIMEKFLWAVPSATNVEIPDISLFDHLKTTSAIAGCLHISDDSHRPFVLVAGDFGGIQKYVFNLRPGSGGLAKALRGRSFEVGALTDACAMGILSELQLSLAHMVISAGGRFYLLLPNTEKTLRALAQHRDCLHEWILEEKHGELRFNLAWIDISPDDILDFPATLIRMNRLLVESSVLGLSPLKSNSRWDEERWVFPGFSGKSEDLCRSCYARRISEGHQSGEEKALCRVCQGDRDIGRDFVRASYQIIDAGRELGYRTPFSQYSLSSKTEEADRAANLVVEFRGKLQENYEKPFFTILKNNWVPHDSAGNVLEFDNIADRSEGKPLLGYLKADVDNLGFIFSRGLVASGEDSRDRKSISRLTTLSRSLEYFFSGFVCHFLEERYPDTYTVFSGGDDLLLIGPWDQIFSLAKDLRKEFARYTCHNPAWGLSAGIVVVKPRTPVLQGQQLANKNLVLAKKQPKKDSITAFSTTMSWEDYSRALEQGDRLTEWLKEGTLNTGKVYRFYGYAQQLQQFHLTGNTSLLRVIPQMIYDLTRNWGNRSKEQREAKQWAHAFTNPENEEIKTLPFVCQYALNKTR